MTGEEKPSCPECGGTEVIKSGHRYRRTGKVQCYVCTTCCRYFTPKSVRTYKGKKPAPPEPTKAPEETPADATVSSGDVVMIKDPATEQPDEYERRRAAYLQTKVEEENATKKPEEP